MEIKKGKIIPQDSLLLKYLPVNYSDIYTCNIESNTVVTPDDIMTSFWTDMPKWVNNLFKLRNTLVKPFGLKTDNEKDFQQLEECIRTGGNFGFISVSDKSPHETVLCLTDKHLTAYLSVYVENSNEKNEVSLITLVNSHNKLGYIYFYTIYPFHHIVVRKMLKSTLKKLLK